VRKLAAHVQTKSSAMRINDYDDVDPE